MLSIPPNTTIYWHTEPTDMRKGIDGGRTASLLVLTHRYKCSAPDGR